MRVRFWSFWIARAYVRWCRSEEHRPEVSSKTGSGLCSIASPDYEHEVVSVPYNAPTSLELAQCLGPNTHHVHHCSFYPHATPTGHVLTRFPRVSVGIFTSSSKASHTSRSKLPARSAHPPFLDGVHLCTLFTKL